MRSGHVYGNDESLNLTARGVARLATSTVVVVLAGCGSSGQPITGGATPYGVFQGSLALKGEVAVKGTFTDTLTSRQETCDQYVHGQAQATTLWVVPSPGNGGEPVGGHAVSFTAGVPSNKPSSGYRGPGTYSAPSAIVADLLIDNASFLPGSEATASIIVANNGSGSLTFSGMIDTSTNAVESGAEQWKCAG